jgi:hypothetical protein
MALTVQIEGEGGEREGELWMHPAGTGLLAVGSSHGSCLRFIDPYGNTLFNQLQIPELLSELRALDNRLTDPELRLALRGLIPVVERAVDQVHTYVRFIGD